MISKPHLYGLIPKQPHPVVSYFTSGKLIHFSVLLFVLESILYFQFLEYALASKAMFWVSFWSVCFAFSFAHIFLVMADGWSRYQDYKRAKDQLFLYGYQLRIINQFASSQCQRNAFTTAASELGFGKEAKTHFHSLGYRWYHLIPDFMIEDPFFFYKRYFWKRTFLEKYYKAKFDYRKLTFEFQYK